MHLSRIDKHASMFLTVYLYLVHVWIEMHASAGQDVYKCTNEVRIRRHVHAGAATRCMRLLESSSGRCEKGMRAAVRARGCGANACTRAGMRCLEVKQRGACMRACQEAVHTDVHSICACMCKR